MNGLPSKAVNKYNDQNLYLRIIMPGEINDRNQPIMVKEINKADIAAERADNPAHTILLATI